MPTQCRSIPTAMLSWRICLTSFGAGLPEARLFRPPRAWRASRSLGTWPRPWHWQVLMPVGEHRSAAQLSVSFPLSGGHCAHPPLSSQREHRSRERDPPRGTQAQAQGLSSGASPTVILVLVLVTLPSPLPAPTWARGCWGLGVGVGGGRRHPSDTLPGSPQGSGRGAWAEAGKVPESDSWFSSSFFFINKN